MLHSNTDQEDYETLLNFASVQSVESFNAFKNIKTRYDWINNDINLYNSDYRIDKIVNLEEQTYRLYRTIYSYVKMIRIAMYSFDVGNVKPLNASENLRFIYQKLHLYYIMLITFKMINALKVIIGESLSVRNNHTKLIEIFEGINYFFDKSKDNLFIKYSGGVTYQEDGKTPELKYILKSLMEYRRVLILMLYNVYLFLFEVNENTEVVSVNKKFLKEIWYSFYSRVERKETEENFQIRVVNSCKNIFINLVKDDRKNNFFKLDHSVFEDCKIKVLDKGILERLTLDEY
eukprot:GAHX01001612.1.p1 GENE.GAHX01001612.1~~GAHX01001612.1.p1  ORF type:complete len:290 (-),score=51.55 GAHX01001612.1:79-948(-)